MNFTPPPAGLISSRLALVLSICVLAVLWAAPSGAVSANVQAADLTIERVEVGFNGLHKVGRWAPVTVHVTTSRPIRVELLVEARDPDGSLTVLPSSPIDIPGAGTHQLHGQFKSGRIDANVRVHVREGTQVLATRQLRVAAGSRGGLPPPLKQSTVLVATLGKPAGFSQWGTGASPGAADSGAAQREAVDRPANESLQVVELDTSQQLPLTADGYDSLNALVIAENFNFDGDEQRHTALRQWVQLGGRLVLAVGSAASEYQESPFAEWVPATVKGESRLRDLSGLESFAGKQARIAFSGRVRATNIDRPRDGAVLASGLDGPLLVRVPYGFGQVTFLALDLHRPPLSAWPSVAGFARRLVNDEDAPAAGAASTARRSADRSQLAHSGITELATQLRASQEHFPEIRRLSSWVVMGLILVYLAVIGPVDYLLVHRLLKKPQLTWITFPLMVAAATVLAIWGAQTTNGRRLEVNQIDLVDIDAHSDSPSVRAQSWMTIYSPETRRYDVEVEPLATEWTSFGLAGLEQPAAAPIRVAGSEQRDRPAAPPPGLRKASDPATPALPVNVTWHGIPETVFGGMYRPGGFDLARPMYVFGENASHIENLPINVWSTKSLTARWSHPATALAESSLESAGGGQLTGGTLTHHLPVPLDDWIIAYGNRVYRPAEGRQPGRGGARLIPHQPWSPFRRDVSQRELKGYLTGTKKTRVGESDILLEQEKYDPANRNAIDIVRMLTFHGMAGGKTYTGLENSQLAALDLSPLLGLDRAVLFGRIDLPAARLKLNGDAVEPARHSVFVRILLPVTRKESARHLPRVVPENR